MTIEQIAERAYNRYGSIVSFRNYQGLPMPLWAELPTPIRAAWLAAAQEVVELVGGETRGANVRS